METWPTTPQDSPAALQPVAAEPDLGTLPTIQPTHRIKFPGADTIQSVDLSPDGRTAYCAVLGKSVDLWAATVSIWPELLGGVVALTLALWCLIVIRVKRRPQTPDEPHCRRCNYNVKAQARNSVKTRGDRNPPAPGVKCPECGTELLRKPPKRGRTMVRRLWPVTMAMALISGGYIAMWAFGVGRAGPMSTAVDWWSEWVDEQAEARQIAWLLKHRVEVSRIMKVDSASGAIVGNLRTIRGRLRSEIRVAPDGRFIVYADAQDRVPWIRVRDGTIAASTGTSFARVAWGIGSRGIVGFDGPADDPRVYFAAVDQIRKISQLIRWRPSTGESQVIVEEPYGKDNPYKLPRKYAILKCPNGTATLSAPNFSQAYEEKSSEWTIRAPPSDGGGTMRVVDNVGQNTLPCSIETTPDGTAIFVTDLTYGINEFDPKTGTLRSKLRNFGLPGPGIRVSADGSKLIVPVHEASVMVRDLKRRSWVGRADYPIGFTLRSLEPSAGARWLVACVYQPKPIKAPRTQPYSYELFLFDLSPLDQPSGTK